MATIKTQYTQKTASGLDVLHHETDASIVLVDVEGINSENVADALAEINDNIEAITGGGVVTGVKGDAETAYRLGQVNITKANIGLGNVENLAPVDLPVSTATQTALDEKGDRGEKIFYYTGKFGGTGDHAISVQDLHPTPTATTQQGYNAYIGAMIQDQISECAVITGVTGDADMGTISFVATYHAYTLLRETPKANSEAFAISGGTYTAIENAKTAANTYADTKKTEAVTAAKEYTDTQIKALLGDDVDEAYNSFKEIQDLLEGELGSATDGLIGSVNANTQGVEDAKALANGAQATADANTAAIEDIEDGTTKVKKAEVADSATSATTAGKLSGNQTVTVGGDASGSGTWTNSTGAATVNVTLANSGVTAGSYSAVTVDAKGRVTDGAQVIEVGTAGQTEPSASLAVGGIFIKRL